jgi:hypothetical protein
VAKPPEPEYVVDFPTLGFLAADWMSRHCIVPDRFHKGQPFVMADWQLWCTVNHYRVKPTAEWRPENPMLAAAFHYRRSIVIGPQKSGKGPWAAAIICLEAVGPALFAGWAEPGDEYRCADHGCDCGWTYAYDPGEPMGMPWPTPLMQLTATAEDQTDNVWRPLSVMLKGRRLRALARVGTDFAYLPNDGRIDTVTSSAAARLGNPITFALQDETGLYTATNGLVKVAQTQRRGLAGMGGRCIELSNAYDPNEMSQAQLTMEAAARDVFRFHRPPPAHLSYQNKAERRQIHRYVYAGSWWVDLTSIDAEAAELAEKDPAQAERYFGNRNVAGVGTWLERPKWDARKAEAPRVLAKGTAVVLGFDGSDVDDWTAIRAETEDGYQFTPTYGPDKRPCIWNPADWGGQVPRLEVQAAVDELFGFFKVVRMYFDPPGWETEGDQWAAKYGEKKVIRFETYRPAPMFAAVERLLTDVLKADSGLSHDGCDLTGVHVGNARKAARPGGRYVLAKASKAQKIDACVASVLAHEVAGDVTAAKLWPKKERPRLVVMKR